MKTTLARGQLESLLLGIVARGPAHGYEIIAELKERSDGAFDLPEGTVYPVLHRLESDGLLASDWESTTGRRRRIYRVTALGQESLERARAQWRSHSRRVELILGAGA